MPRLLANRVAACLTPLALALAAGAAHAQDVRVLFDGKSKNTMKTVVGAFPKGTDVKSYNVGLLVLADYSGRQKAVAKLNRASVVIIVGDSAQRRLAGCKFTTDVLVAGTTRRAVTSNASILHVIDTRWDRRALGPKPKIVEVERIGDLTREKIREADAVAIRVAPDGPTLVDVAVAIAKLHLAAYAKPEPRPVPRGK
jgi:hypothetical protein